MTRRVLRLKNITAINRWVPVLTIILKIVLGFLEDKVLKPIHILVPTL